MTGTAFTVYHNVLFIVPIMIVAILHRSFLRRSHIEMAHNRSSLIFCIVEKKLVYLLSHQVHGVASLALFQQHKANL